MTNRSDVRGRPRHVVRHGNLVGYMCDRCRCDACREAHTAYRRARREAARGKGGGKG